MPKLPSMPTLDLTVEQVIALVQQLPREEKKAVLEILKHEFASEDNPWLKLAGKYKEDPQFDEMLADIAADRHALDNESSYLKVRSLFILDEL